MKIIRLQISGNFLEHIGFSELFKELKSVEILKAFQYSQNQFFSLQRIKFNPDSMHNLIFEVKSRFNPETFQIIEQTDDEIICIMYQNSSTGFFPIIDSGPWALIFPIYISQEVLLINLISHEDYISKLYNTIEKFTESFQIISITDINNIKNIDSIIGPYSAAFPNFTKRQKEISTYAAKNGFFNSPKKISSKKIADHFGISISAVNKHIRDAEIIAMEFFFGKFKN
ncbi:MAG: helix-turn-helix domain-containing protein [Candidatus Lokiarchaeota archaeon]|nr:helix-turn-helix domain-containing protein [Candidatus Lokiarchaeota archaeon]